MASFTTNRAYAQPLVGGDVGVWGPLLNNNVAVLDANISGGGASAVNCAGNSNVTATTAQAQNLVQYLTGALTGNIEYILPALGWFYIVDNATTGAFTVTVITSAGGSTGVVVPQGTTMVLYSDGTNVYSATDAYVASGGTVASLTVTGLLTAGTVDTGTIATAGQLLIEAGTSGAAGLVTIQNNNSAASSAAGWEVETGTAGSTATFELVENGSGTVAATLNFGAAVASGTISVGASVPVTIAQGGTNVLGVTAAGAVTTFSAPLVIGGTGTVTINNGSITAGGPVSAANGTTLAQVLNLSQFLSTIAAPFSVKIPGASGAMLIQAGTGSTNGSGNLTVTFATAFSATPVVVASPSYLASDSLTTMIYELTSTGMLVVATHTTTAAVAGNLPVYWIAIGPA
jgi:hypothetical protein